MSGAASVLVCVLDLLGRSAGNVPPIVIVPEPPPGVSANADAFLNRSNHTIYLIASARWFRVANTAEERRPTRGRCTERNALKMLASIIVHEEWHLKYGSDEKGAYHAQLTELNRLGLGGGTWASYTVTRSMLSVVGAQSKVQNRPDSPSLLR